MTKNGISTTKKLGSENYQRIKLAAMPRKTFVQYDYRHIDGELFSTVASSLEICRQRKEEWLRTKNGN